MKSLDNNKVSIITPVYNSAAYLAETICSVLAQTYLDWELILIDDCSTDNSLSLINEYSRNDIRIKVIQQSHNQGQIFARNRGLDSASGRYIAFLDSDDIWVKDKLEKQITFLNERGAAIIHSYYDYIDEESAKLNKVIKAPEKITYNHLLNTNYLGCLTVLYDTLKTDKQKMPNVGKRDDWACWLNILKQGHTAYCIPEVLASYRVRTNSLSSNKLKTIQYNWGILRRNQGLSFTKTSYHFIVNIFLSIKKYYFS